MKRIFAAIILLILFPVSYISAAESLNNELTKCAAITRDLQRLSCYDKLAGLASTFGAEEVKTKAKEILSSNTDKPTVTLEAAATTEKMPEGTFGLTGKNAKPVPSSSEDFGLNKAPSNLDELSSSIVGEFTGWKKGDKITLANGQVWKIVDDRNSIYHKATDPEITITRGVFDSYRISIKGLNKAARVVRVK